MAKTVYDYDSNEDGFTTTPIDKSDFHGVKRNYDQFKNHFTSKIDKILAGKKTIIEDLEKHCRNKRLKKNIYKMDCVNIGGIIHKKAPT
jgi:hypothetical protein